MIMKMTNKNKIIYDKLISECRKYYYFFNLYCIMNICIILLAELIS